VVCSGNGFFELAGLLTGEVSAANGFVDSVEQFLGSFFHRFPLVRFDPVQHLTYDSANHTIQKRT
jgi:hypothetical protein